ncbi:MAG: beta-phosphoglucomutase [Bacteroidetes bacterium]|nr:beta-phosphoglucomutase [Bacteroidota bacterium]MBU1373248.1 beta-phosphoglucomutase [Bacteroidota bacterium]MBU1486320.1 beta-phosphoglucomutase [Bacteroidota bacterium]MBU1760296.1 beta-phosphoglucomutase [Bacteroidota bacterium]MBU2269278.1 beta-phosphoglucomutase [Bacteroidota bacterium]
MSEIKACLFDLDGVIVDTAKYHFKAWKRLANELGIDFTEKENEQLKGVSRVESLQLILKWGGLEKNDSELQNLATLKNTWYVDMINKMKADEILPGARELLNELRANGIKIALGSASKNSEAILFKINLYDAFDAIVDGTIVSKSKPDPEVFLKGAELLGEKPENCIVFEDAVAGVEAAISGGMRVVGIGESQTLYKADWVVSGLDQINLKKLQNQLS